MQIERIYDRSDLINVTTTTVLRNMIAGILLIFAVQWAFLGNLRSALIVATTIPFALFFAIVVMTARGESANLLSVGAIDFGLVVDATVIMMENIYRRIAHARTDRGRVVTVTAAQRASGFKGKMAAIAEAATQVNRAIFFSAAIIVAGFIPLFTMSGVEGHIFGPMARTYAYAILGGLIATFTITPALSSFLLPARLSEADTFVVRWMRKIYSPVVEFALANRILALGVAVIIFVLAGVAARGLGSEFLPHLEEGNLWIRASMPASISLQAGDSYGYMMRRIIKSYPEVETVVSQHGRPDDGTDATGFFNAEFFAPLKPAGQWPSGVDKAKLVDDLTKRLGDAFPGVDFNFSQYIEDNVEEAASGVKGENSVKLYGNDLNALQSTAEKIDRVMGTVPGIADLAVFNSLGQPAVRIDVDRDKAARYGLAPGDVNEVVQTAIGGEAAGNLYEEGSDRNFPIMVRLAPRYRANLDAIRQITVGVQNPAGTGIMQIPLSDLATVKLVSGASFIYRENQERYIPIKFSVRARDLGGAVLDAQRRIGGQVKLPSGYRLEWVGEFGEFQEAIQRLAVIVPLSILLIGFMLYINFGTFTDTLLAASVIPMTLVGGIFALVLTGTAFSVSAAIGFVALFGISVMDGIIVLTYFNRMVDEGRDKLTALNRTCEIQMRPVMMTCGGVWGLVSRRDLHRHRLASPEAPGPGGGGRHAAGAGFHSSGAAGFDRDFLQARSCRRRRCVRRGRAMRKILALLPAVTLLGCTMGPDFKPPAPPAANAYTKAPLTQTSGDASVMAGAPQAYAMDRDIPGEWWTLFRSPELDVLVRASIANNPNLTAAQAALNAAMENVKAQIGAYYPQVTGGVAASRQSNSVILSPTLASNNVLMFSLYQAQLGASWTLDLWGANKRQVEALRAQAEAQHYQLEATYVALTANVVAAAVEEASLRDQIAITGEMLAAERQILAIEQRQKDLGQIAGADVAAQQVIVAQTEETLPPLEKQLAEQRDLLTALAGRLPSDEIPQSLVLDKLTLPQELPVSLPAKLVEQRPDIKIAEANLHAASAEVGVAIANMLPNISLNASYGTVGTEVSQLFGPGAGASGASARG